MITKLGQVWDECPARWLERQVLTMMYLRDRTFLRQYGILPRAGGLLDQEARFIEALEVIEGASAKVALKVARIEAARADAHARHMRGCA